LCVVSFSPFSFPSASTLFQCLRRSAFHRGSVLLLAVHIRLYIYHCPGKRDVLAIESLQYLVLSFVYVAHDKHRELGKLGWDVQHEVVLWHEQRVAVMGSCSRIVADVRLYINPRPVKRVVLAVVSHQNIVSSTAVLNPCFRVFGPRPESWERDNGFVVVIMGSCSRVVLLTSACLHVVFIVVAAAGATDLVRTINRAESPTGAVVIMGCCNRPPHLRAHDGEPRWWWYCHRVIHRTRAETSEAFGRAPLPAPRVRPRSGLRVEDPRHGVQSRQERYQNGRDIYVA
jgi:hypothetical protein